MNKTEKIVVVAGRNRRTYSRTYKRESSIAHFLNHCMEKEREKCLEKDGGGITPISLDELSNTDGFAVYRFNYAVA